MTDAALKRQAEQQAEEQKNRRTRSRRHVRSVRRKSQRRTPSLRARRMEADQKREKSLAEAAARLKEAQAAYQAEIEKAKGQSNDKTKSSGKATSPSTPRQKATWGG